MLSDHIIQDPIKLYNNLIYQNQMNKLTVVSALVLAAKAGTTLTYGDERHANEMSCGITCKPVRRVFVSGLYTTMNEVPHLHQNIGQGSPVIQWLRPWSTRQNVISWTRLHFVRNGTGVA